MVVWFSSKVHGVLSLPAPLIWMYLFLLLYWQAPCGALTIFGGMLEKSILIPLHLLLIGRYLQQRQQRLAEQTTFAMHAILPRTARCLRNHEIYEVNLDQLSVNDVLEVRSGDKIPVDGVVIQGSSHIDVSMLTGESRPKHIQIGDPVHAGNECYGYS